MAISFDVNKEVILQFIFDQPKERKGKNGKYYVWGVIDNDGEEDIINVSIGLFKKLKELNVKKGDKVSIKKITYTNDNGEPRAGWEVKHMGLHRAELPEKEKTHTSNIGAGRYTEEEIYAFNIKDAITNAVKLISAKIKSGDKFKSINDMVTKIDVTAEKLYKLHKTLEHRLKKAENTPKEPEEDLTPEETEEIMPPLEPEDDPSYTEDAPF